MEGLPLFDFIWILELQLIFFKKIKIVALSLIPLDFSLECTAHMVHKGRFDFVLLKDVFKSSEKTSQGISNLQTTGDLW